MPATCSGPPGSAAVAAGSPEVVQAARAVLARGGSAVDAALAGALAATMSEPVLASVGGGGFLVAWPPGEEPVALDFFVDVPGLGRPPGPPPPMQSVVVDFGRTGSAATTSEQVFHGGWGSVAVPGVLDGLVVAHDRLGRVDLADVVAPAVALARRGVDLSAGQRTFVHLVEDLLTLTPDSRRLWDQAQRTGRYANPGLADLLAEVAAGRVRRLADHEVGEVLLAASDAGGGALTTEDLQAYLPRWSAPTRVDRGAATVWVNPSSGGAIVSQALRRLPVEPQVDWGRAVAALVEATDAVRRPGQVATGTTHVSVVDADGGLAALTLSNGSGSGAVIPGWGVTLNNMLGEDDLRPADGSALAAGTRMASMMTPTLVELADGTRVAMGSGGSERIRSAILATALRLVDDGQDLAAAVAAPRVHATGAGPVHAEPGLGAHAIGALASLARERGWSGVEEWPAPNLFFGGVHAVQCGPDGAVAAVGDGRRTGSVGTTAPGAS